MGPATNDDLDAMCALLETAAAVFFADRLGFTAIERVDVPEAVRQSVQFIGACPQTAQAMVRELLTSDVHR